MIVESSFFEDEFNLESLKFLLTRFVQFSLISLSIYHNYDYYKKKFPSLTTKVIACIVIIGLFINPYLFDGERYSGIIWNPNMLAALLVIGFSLLLLNPRKKTNFEYFLLIVFLIIALATGSRGVLIGISLVFIFKFGFSIRNIVYALLAISIYSLVVTIQLDTSVNRFADQSLFNDRLLQYEYSYETLIQKPFFGYGLDKYSYIDKSLVPSYLKGKIIGAHNGYLAILVQYGFVFSFLVLGIIFRQSFSFVTKAHLKNKENISYIYIVVYTLIAAIYETLMTGINEFQTILFWLALAFLSYSKFNQENAN